MTWLDHGWRFVIVGGLVGLVWLLLTATLSALGLRAAIASALAFLCCMPLAYLGHRRFTFRSDGNLRSELPRFLVNSALGLVVAWGLPSAIGDDVVTSMWAVPVGMMVVSFLVARSWVFVRS